jgi:cyclohexyl-isocyanide hydratase
MTETKTVGMVLYDGCTLLDFAGATQIFAFPGGYDVKWLAAESKNITTTENVTVVPHATFDDAPPLDVVFVPGGGPAVAAVMNDARYTDFLKRTAERARYLGAVCTGAFIVAAAGLFDGHEATTYWSQLDNLRLFPRVRVPYGYPRFVISGQRFSGGGISSSIDLALEIVLRMDGLTAAQTHQLANQYAPDPPVRSGDPAQAPPALAERIVAAGAEFSAAMREGTLRAVGHRK